MASAVNASATSEGSEIASAGERTDPVHRNARVRRPATTVIAVVVVLFGVYFARPVLAPICFAWLLKVALSPIVRGLRGVGVPMPLGAALVLSILTAAFIVAAYELTGPAADWLGRLPDELPRIERKLLSLREPLEQVGEVTEKVEKLADSSPDKEVPLTVEVAGRTTLLSRMFSGAWFLVVGGVVTLALLYFMLATDEFRTARLVDLSPRFRDKHKSAAVLQSIESEVGRYLLTICAINTLLGVAVGVAMSVLGMPNPALWGAVAALLNFVPYVGAAVGIGVVAAVSLITFDDVGAILAPPLAYLCINVVEGMLVTPAVLGRRLSISPVVLFAWLMFASWLWGLPGALLAVPLLVVAKISSDHVAVLAPLHKILCR